MPKSYIWCLLCQISFASFYFPHPRTPRLVENAKLEWLHQLLQGWGESEFILVWMACADPDANVRHAQVSYRGTILLLNHRRRWALQPSLKLKSIGVHMDSANPAYCVKWLDYKHTRGGRIHLGRANCGLYARLANASGMNFPSDHLGHHVRMFPSDFTGKGIAGWTVNIKAPFLADRCRTLHQGRVHVALPTGGRNHLRPTCQPGESCDVVNCFASRFATEEVLGAKHIERAATKPLSQRLKEIFSAILGRNTKNEYWSEAEIQWEHALALFGSRDGTIPAEGNWGHATKWSTDFVRRAAASIPSRIAEFCVRFRVYLIIRRVSSEYAGKETVRNGRELPSCGCSVKPSPAIGQPV